MREDEDGDVMTPDEEEDGTPEISLHAITAITGNGPIETMKTYGRIGWSNLLVLIDSGNTHNFMSLSLAHVLKLQLGEEGGMDVTITSGEKIRSPDKCVQVPVELQGMIFTVDFYILPLEGYEVVLGTQWLRILRPIHWDFETLEMQFVWDKEPIILHGIKSRVGMSQEFLSLYPEVAENSKEMLEQNMKEKEEEIEQGWEEHGVFFTKPELKQNGKKKEEEMEPRMEGQWVIFTKLELFLGDKEVVRGRDDTFKFLGLMWKHMWQY
jgi:hypothetical protein